MATGLQPMLWGRVTRVLAGAACLWWAVEIWAPDVGAVVGSVALAVLGLSFLVGGVMANPGCEITALPNLLLPPERRLHAF